MKIIKYTVEVSGVCTKWFLENTNLLHREDGPAMEFADVKSWWKNGELHREDGPAIEYANGNKDYYLHGICFLPEQYNKFNSTFEFRFLKIHNKKVIGKYHTLEEALDPSSKLCFVNYDCIIDCKTGEVAAHTA